MRPQRLGGNGAFQAVTGRSPHSWTLWLSVCSLTSLWGPKPGRCGSPNKGNSRDAQRVLPPGACVQKSFCKRPLVRDGW